MSISFFALFLLVAIPLMAMVGVFFLIALRILKGDRGNAASAEEAALIQDLHRGMNRMEQRIEALETLLLEQNSSEKDHAKNQ